jgi:signal transduction histidine kinase
MNDKPVRVVLIEDNAADAELVGLMFRGERTGSFELTHLTNMSTALPHIAKGEADIILLDMGLPDGQGIDILRRAQSAAPGVPLIVLTGTEDEALAAQAMKEGAQDYLIKGQIEKRALPRVLRYAIERHRMQVETDFIRAQQLQLKDEFLSHVSHELRSPLTAIYQFVSILADGLAGELNSEQREYLQIALKNSRQLKAMIDDLLEVTRVQAGKLRIDLQVVSIPDLIADIVATLQETAADKEITLSSNVAPEVQFAYADPGRVRQVLINLIDNALKFTPRKGVVSVQARLPDKNPQLVAVEVSDSGCGIHAGAIEKIFDRLYQAPDTGMAGRKGLGFGLHICKELVTRQGGQIWAKSEPGKGAALTFTLPIFSIARLIAPAFLVERSAERSVALVVTELESQSGWLSRQADEEASYQVRDVLSRCMHSDLDVLLPKMGPATGTECFFIVAVTDELGGEAITKRIRKKLAESGHIQEAGMTYSASYRLFSANRAPHEPMADYIDRIALKIKETVDSETSLRVAQHEQ